MLVAQVEDLKAKISLSESYHLEDSDDDEDYETTDAVLSQGTNTDSTVAAGPAVGNGGAVDLDAEVSRSPGGEAIQ